MKLKQVVGDKVKGEVKPKAQVVMPPSLCWTECYTQAKCQTFKKLFVGFFKAIHVTSSICGYFCES